eukprot:8185188-Pyramimonas_sp.AAC.2
MSAKLHHNTSGLSDTIKRKRMAGTAEDERPMLPRNLHKAEGQPAPGGTEESENPDELKLWQAYIHVVKGNIGPGCLSMPYAFSQGGLITSLCVLFTFAPACIYCMLLLVWCKHKMLADGGARGLSARHINFEEVRATPDS